MRFVSVAVALMPLVEARAEIRLWDTNKRYTQKFYSMQQSGAWQDKANWSPLKYGVVDYRFKGDAVLEGENFWLFLHSSRYDAVFLYAKKDEEGTPSRHNELYRVYDTPNGLRNYGGGSQFVKVIKNEPEEIIVISEAISYTRGGNPTTVTTAYRVLRGKHWLEIRPLFQADEQGMHGESRFVLAPEALVDSGDFVEDSLRRPGNFVCRVPMRAKMLLDLVMDDDTVWVLSAGDIDPGTKLKWGGARFWNANAPGGWHAGWSRIGEGQCDRVWTAPFVFFANKPVYIGVCRIGFWHYQKISPSAERGLVSVKAGVVFKGRWKWVYQRPIKSSPFKRGGRWYPLYPGKWRMVASIDGKYYTTEVIVKREDVGKDTFTLTSPVDGTLEYIIFYLYDRTSETPLDVSTPMDIYRETHIKPEGYGSLEGKVTGKRGRPIKSATVTLATCTGTITTTTTNGTFSFESLPAGAHPLMLRAEGFEKTYAGVTIEAGRNSKLTITLEPDRTPPVISNVRVTELTDTTVALSLQTNEKATCELSCGDKRIGESGGAKIKHNLTITNLTPNTRYIISIMAKDMLGNESKSQQFSFRTLPLIDPEPPRNWSFYIGDGKGKWGRTSQESHSGNFSAFLKAVAYRRGAINIALIAGNSDGYVGKNAYPAEPGARYRYSFWAKGDFKEVWLWLWSWTKDTAGYKSRRQRRILTFRPSEKWKKFAGEFTMPETARRFVLGFKAYGETPTRQNLGVLFVDDFELTLRGRQVPLNGGAENE